MLLIGGWINLFLKKKIKNKQAHTHELGVLWWKAGDWGCLSCPTFKISRVSWLAPFKLWFLCRWILASGFGLEKDHFCRAQTPFPSWWELKDSVAHQPHSLLPLLLGDDHQDIPHPRSPLSTQGFLLHPLPVPLMHRTILCPPSSSAG